MTGDPVRAKAPSEEVVHVDLGCLQQLLTLFGRRPAGEREFAALLRLFEERTGRRVHRLSPERFILSCDTPAEAVQLAIDIRAWVNEALATHQALTRVTISVGEYHGPADLAQRAALVLDPADWSVRVAAAIRHGVRYGPLTPQVNDILRKAAGMGNQSVADLEASASRHGPRLDVAWTALERATTRQPWLAWHRAAADDAAAAMRAGLSFSRVLGPRTPPPRPGRPRVGDGAIRAAVSRACCLVAPIEVSREVITALAAPWDDVIA